MKSIMQDEKVCIITGCTTGLDRHHIYHGIRRKAAEKYGCWCWLRHDLHMELHDMNKALDLMLERACQERFEGIYSHQEFMDVFGKNYL
jgi:hypothetical protein